jgi:hypothetical protein
MGILIACIILNAFIGVIFKLFHRYNIDNLQAIVINYFVCVATAMAVKGGSPIPSDLSAQPWFYYALGLGFIFIIVFNLMALYRPAFWCSRSNYISKNVADRAYFACDP